MFGKLDGKAGMLWISWGWKQLKLMLVTCVDRSEGQVGKVHTWGTGQQSVRYV